VTPERAREIAREYLKKWEQSHDYHSPTLIDCSADAILAAVAEAIAAPVPVPMEEAELLIIEAMAAKEIQFDGPTTSHLEKQRLAAEIRILWRLLHDCDGVEAYKMGYKQAKTDVRQKCIQLMKDKLLQDKPDRFCCVPYVEGLIEDIENMEKKNAE
jgi:hypothetical protein